MRINTWLPHKVNIARLLCLRSIRQLSRFTFFSSFSLRRFLRGSDVISTPGGEHITAMKLYCSSRWSWWSFLVIPAVSTKKINHIWIIYIEIFHVPAIWHLWVKIQPNDLVFLVGMHDHNKAVGEFWSIYLSIYIYQHQTNVKSSNKCPHLWRKIIPTKRTPALNISTTFSNPHM